MSRLSTEERAAEATRDIRRAFEDAPKPRPDAITIRSPGFPQYDGDEESVIQNFFAGRDWRDMTYQAMREGLTTPEYAALGFMTPEAFRYFLRAYMPIALDEYDISDVTADTAINMLITDRTPYSGSADDPESWFSRNISGLSDVQRRAIAGFLLAMQELHGQDYSEDSSPMEALQKYWSRYLPEEDQLLAGRVKGRPRITQEDVERVQAEYYAKLKASTDA